MTSPAYKYIQKIIFGSPGTGKSYQIREIAVKQLGIKIDSNGDILSNSVKAVFHPEYTYSDFMGKLLPLSSGNAIIYRYYPGHFLQALGMAYKGLIENKNENYLLVIDELNRGNAAAIFGSIFQLLDRNDDGWSTYEVNISEMERVGLLNAMGYKTEVSSDNIIIDRSHADVFFENFITRQGMLLTQEYVDGREQGVYVDSLENGLFVMNLLKQSKIKIPPNLSIIATINTSDESIHYLDSAFKRRWNWEYVDAPSTKDIDDNKIPLGILYVKLDDLDWYRCVVGVNEFLKYHHHIIRRIEDKQIGWWFIKPIDNKVTIEQIKDKLMFYLWDGVFVRNKQSLVKYIEDKLGKKGISLVTYADFLNHTQELLKYWHNSVTAVKQLSDDDDKIPGFE